MLWCVLARRAARPCHIAWSHRLSAGVILSLARASTLEATSLRRCMLCVLARRVARRCHIAWSHRLSAAVILSLARASTLEATCSSEGGHEPRHVLANPAISMSANVYLGLRKTLHFCPQQTSTKNLHLTVPVRCRWNLMFVAVDIAVLAIRFFIGNHFRRASLQLVRP